MSISLNKVNSEVVRAHTRIDGLGTGAMGFPDFNAGEKINNNTEYTADTNGFISVELAYNEGSEIAVYINSIRRYFYYAAYGTFQSTTMYAIRKGCKYKVNANPIQSLMWFPELKYYFNSVICAFSNILREVI